MGFILVSVLLAHMLIPIWAARDRSLKSALRKALLAAAVFDGVYLVVLHLIQLKLSAHVLEVLNSGI